MKSPMTKKSIMSKVALLTLTIMTFSPIHGSMATDVTSDYLKVFKDFFKTERVVSTFFDSNDKTRWNLLRTKMGNDLAQYENALEAITRRSQDSCATLAHDVVEYSRQLFSAIYGVIKKYEGNDAKEVNNFKLDIKRVFDPEVAFEKIISKLETLKKKAVLEGHNELVLQITAIIAEIKKKRDSWIKKSEFQLGMGLITRFNCQ